MRAAHVPLRIPLQTSNGTTSIASLQLDRKPRARFRLLGVKGVVGVALAGIDLAAWDALATAQGLPLARALGGELRRIRSTTAADWA